MSACGHRPVIAWMRRADRDTLVAALGGDRATMTSEEDCGPGDMIAVDLVTLLPHVLRHLLRGALSACTGGAVENWLADLFAAESTPPVDETKTGTL